MTLSSISIRSLLTVLALAVLSSIGSADDYLLVPRHETDPGFTYHPSPGDWRDTNIYQIFTDRFEDGDHSNNFSRQMAWGYGWNGEQMEGKPWYNEYNSADANARHLAQGGDWRGIRDRIPYLQELGVKAVWISSVQRTEQGVDKRYTPYHAYHPTDLYRVEPMFGTFQDLKDLIDALHDAGMYVILDVVPNHLADLLGLGDGRDDYYHHGGGGSLNWWNSNIRHAPPFDQPYFFNNNGRIINWGDYSESLYGAFVGTDDLKTSDPFVQQELINAFKHLIEATDCDGFRVDAIKHVEFDFIRHWANEMRQHAASLGKDDFLLFGEYFSYNDNDHIPFARDEGYSFNSVMYFSMMQTLKNVFEHEGGTDQLGRIAHLDHFGEAATRMVTFLDNHDVDRICLRKGDTWADTLRPAVGFLYTASPIPTILYGTEHGFNQGGRENRGLSDGDYQRENMMDFGYQWGNAHGNKFESPSEIKDLIGAINEARDQYIALRRGGFQERWASQNKGIYAFTRRYDNQEALVILNTDWNQQSAQPSVDSPDGTVFTNLLSPTETATVRNGGLSLDVPRKGVKVFINEAPGLRIANTRNWPANGAVEPGATVWIDSETSPAGEAVSGEVIVSTDGGNNWTNHAFSANGTVTGRDAWHVQIGSFDPETAVLYAVNFTDGNGDKLWDSNGGANYGFTVSEGAPPPPVRMENTRTSIPDSSIEEGQDLIVLTESTPAGIQVGGSIVYSSDGGETWSELALQADGSTNDRDDWRGNLGSFPAGTEIRFAVMTRNAGNEEVWDNNGGLDYRRTVQARSIPAASPRARIALQGNRLTLDLRTLAVGTQYTVERSSDLVDWRAHQTFTAAGEEEAHTLYESMPTNGPMREFYRLRASGNENTEPLQFEIGAHGPFAVDESVILSATVAPLGAAGGADLVYSVNGGGWLTAPMSHSPGTGSDVWSVDLGVLGDASIAYAIVFQPADGGESVWANNGGEDYAVVSGEGSGNAFGPDRPYSTNPSLGTAGTMTIDGTNTNGEWGDQHLIAISLAGDDPRTLGDNWTLHEAPVDFTHLWAAWDDDYLYLAYQLVDVTDMIDPANAGSAGGGKINRNDGILVWIAFDTSAGGATLDMWEKNNGSPLFGGDDSPDIQLYHNGNPWQAFLSRAVDGTFPVDDGGVNYFNLKQDVPGFAIETDDGFHGSSLWGVYDADNRTDESQIVNFLDQGHDTTRDSFYELRIPLSLLQLTRSQLETGGIGVKIGTSVDTIPFDVTTLDTQGVEVWNSSLEWGDTDLQTTPFARIGAWK